MKALVLEEKGRLSLRESPFVRPMGPRDVRIAGVAAGAVQSGPAVSFWATPPVHGCLMPEVTHPADFTYPPPDNVNFAEGAMVEPLAVGIQAANKAGIAPGDVAVVTGRGRSG